MYFIGLRFEKKQNINSYPFIRSKNDIYGAIISAPEIIKAFYGAEGTSKKYTKHNIAMDNDILIIYYNYKNEYHSGSKKLLVRRKHIGSIIDKEWKVISCQSKTDKGNKSPMYLLKNIKTGEEIKISSRCLFDIEKGITSIENIKTCRSIGTYTYKGKKRVEKRKRIALLQK